LVIKMSFVFNTNIPRTGIDWRNFSDLTGYVDAINQNRGKTTDNQVDIVSFPGPEASGSHAVLTGDGNVIFFTPSTGVYKFNPALRQFTLMVLFDYENIDKSILLDDGNIFGSKPIYYPEYTSYPIFSIFNPITSSYIRVNEEIAITAVNQYQNQNITLTPDAQTISISLESGTGPRYIPGVIVNVSSGGLSFEGTVTDVFTNTISVSKISQTGNGTISGLCTISVTGQTQDALNQFKLSILNYQKLPTSIYVLTDSSFNRDAYINPTNWTIQFSTKSLNTGYKSSSIYNSTQIIFPKTTFTKIINTRSITWYAITDGTNLELISNTGSVSLSNSSIDSEVFCFLPQINIPAGSTTQGQILLSLKNGNSKIWNLNGNTITETNVPGLSSNTWVKPLQLLDGRILVQPKNPSQSQTSSIAIYGGGGGFNPNVTLSPYFNKYN